MGTANRIIKNTGYLYAKMGITMFVSLYTTRLILNSLGASDYGVFNIVGGAIALLGFLNASMAATTQRFMSYSEGEGNTSKQLQIFNISTIIHIALAIVVGILLLFFAFFLFNGILNIPSDRIYASKIVYASLIISTMFTIMSVPYDSVLNAHENMRYYAIVGIIESLLKLSVALACVYTSCDKLIVYGILMSCVPLITLTIMRIYCHRKYNECQIKLRKYFDRKLSLEMLRFAGWNVISSFTHLLSHQASNLVLNHFFGTIVNAAQGITYQISGQLGALSFQVTKVMNPIIIKDAGASNIDGMYKVSSFGSKITFFITSVIFLPFLINEDYFLQIWLKNVPNYTSIFIFLYFTVNLIDNLGIYFTTAVNGVGKIRGMNILNSISSILPFCGSILLFSNNCLPYWLYALMIVTALLKLVGRIYFAYKHCSFNLYNMMVFDTIFPFASFLIVLLPLTLANREIANNLINVFIISILSVVLYLFVYWFAGLNRNDRNIVLKLVKNRISLEKIKSIVKK